MAIFTSRNKTKRWIHEAVFKWLSKVMTRLPLLLLVIALKVSRQFFNHPLKNKSKTNRAWCARFFPRLQVAGNSDWFNASFTHNVIRELKDLTTATSTTPPQINDLIGWMKNNNRAARAARYLVHCFDVVCQTTTWNFHIREFKINDATAATTPQNLHT